jgi:histidyl-tRNA synthetase
MEEIKKEELDKLMKIEGEIKGVAFQADAKYILEKEGEEGLKKLEKRVKEFGYPIDYRTVRALNFYPIGLRVISLLLIKGGEHG